MRIYQRTPGGYYYGVFDCQKKRTRRCLKTRDKTVAWVRIRNLARAAAAGRWDAIETTKHRADHSKLGEVFVLYRAHATVATTTRDKNIAALGSLIRHARPDLSSVTIKNGLADLSSELLTRELMSQMQRGLVEAAGADRLRQDTAAVTANSIRRQARSLFTAELMHYYKGLSLPHLADFMAVKPLREPGKQFRLPDRALLDRIRMAAPLLKTADPNLFRIYLLSLTCGLRKNEIAHARPDWIVQTSADVWVLQVQTTEDFRPKSRQARTIPLDAGVAAELLVRDPSLTYLLAGTQTERIKDSFDRFGVWLRSLGWTRRKGAHELRKLFGSLIADAAGVNVAQALLGHSSINTTVGYYVAPLKTPALDILGHKWTA